MSVEMLYTEKFELNPELNIFDDPFRFFAESDQIELEYYQAMYEASIGTTIKNFPKNAWALIKKFFGWMKKQVQKFLSWIAGLFKKKTRTIDDILIDLGVNVSKDKKSGKTKLLLDPRSKMAGIDDLEAIEKPFFMQFDADKKRIFIKYKEAKAAYKSAVLDIAKKEIFGKADSDQSTNGMIKGFGAALPQHARYDLVFKIITEPNYQQQITNIAKTILDNNTEIAGTTMNEFKSFIKNVNNSKVKINGGKIAFSLDQLMAFQKWLNETFDMVTEFGTPDNTKYENNKEVVNLINEFLEFCNCLQMGMNIISNAMKSIYLIDADWLESIDDINVLGKFVDHMLEAGIPPKFIMFNACLVASKKLKGDADHNKPVCGQTRLIFFPYDSKIVYKVALSKMGVLSNKAEHDLYIKLKDAGIGDMFAATFDGSSSFSVIKGERVSTSRKCTPADAEKMKKKVIEATDKIGLPIGIDHDIHFKNIGYRGDQMVVLDYGNNTRRFIKNDTSSGEKNKERK